MRIGMLLDHPYPPDDRVKKEAVTLSENGHDVFLLCVTYENDEASHQETDQFKISRFYYNKKLHKKYNASYLVLPFHYWKWRRETKKFIVKNDIQVLHIHDLPLSNIGVYFKQKFGLKLVCDQHEYYSNWIGHTAHYNTFLGRIIKYLSNWKKFEREMLKRADLVITVEEPLRKCYINDVGIESKKAICVQNTPLKSVFNYENVDKSIIEKYSGNFIIFYAGVIDVLRGLDIVIESLIHLENKIPNVKFLIAGRTAKGFNPIEEAKKNKVEQLVDFIGWQSQEILPSYIAASKICIFTPHLHNDEINKTVATKIYQYILMGKPIITSRAKMMAELIEHNQIGFSISNSNEFVEAVEKLYNNAEMEERIRKNCKKIADRFDWETTSKSLIDSYHLLEEKPV